MSFLLSTARKDLLRRRRDPISLALWIGIPAVIALLLGAIGSDGSGPPRASVLVADRDSSFASRLVLGAAGSGESPIALTEVSEEEGRRRMDDGEASALVVFPEGFGRALLASPSEGEEAPAVTVVTDPAQSVLPRIAVQGVRTLADLAFFAQQVLGGTLSEMTAGPAAGEFFEDARVADLSSRLNARLRGLGGVLFPPVIDLEVTVRGGSGGGGFGIGRLLLPGIIFMSLLLVSEGLASDLWEERKTGTLDRWRSAPHPLPVVLAGKLLAGAAVAAVVAAVGFGAGALLVNVRVARLPLAVAWSAAAVTCLVPLFYLLHLTATSQRGGNLVANMVLFPLLMLGGSFFPFEAMPGWMASIGAWLPNGRAVLVLRDLLDGSARAAEVAATGGGLLLFGAVCFAATAYWMPRRLARSGRGGGA